MADKKISELTSITGANTASGDLFVIVDVDANETKKITRDELTNALELTDFDNIDINGGTIDGTVIGGASAAAGTFTTGQFNTSVNVDGTVTADGLTIDGSPLIQGAQPYVTLLDSVWTTGATLRSGVNTLGTAIGDYFLINAPSGKGVSISTNNSNNLATFATNGDISFYDTSANPAFFWDASAASLGIGTSSPSTKIHINGADGTSGLFVQKAATAQSFFGAESTWLGTGSSANTVVATYGSTNILFGVAGVTKATLDSSGNLGLGVTPSASNLPTFESEYGLISGKDEVNIIQSAYYNSGFKYSKSEAAGRYLINSGIHSWYTAASGTAGNAITFTQAMTLDASGRLGIGGATSPSSYQSNADDLVVATTGHTGITIASGASHLGNIHFADGTSGDDAYRGFIQYEHTANYMRFATNATEAMRIDSSGNVGIGTTSPAGVVGAGKTLVVSNTGHSTISVQAVDGTNDRNATFELLSSGNGNSTADLVFGDTDTTPVTPSPLRFLGRHSGTTTERMRIDSSGNVGIGTSSPASKLHVQRADDGVIGTFRGTSDAQLLLSVASGNLVYDASNGNATHVWQGNTSERARIDSSGNLLVGKTNASASNAGVYLTPAGTSSSAMVGTGTNYHWVFINDATGTPATVGSISTSGSSTAYNTSSDARLKENIQDASSASDVIDAIQVRAFDWKADGSHQRYGMVAQELLEVAPEAVSGDPNSEDMMGVDYSKLVPMLVKEIQELRARVNALENQ